MVDEPALNDDFVDLLRAFDEAGVDFVGVGATRSRRTASCVRQGISTCSYVRIPRSPLA